ncbi:MAG: transcription antitermination factor NusB [Chitinophagales bacterium]|nr:transcription antitermination factor NusB [Bacteroidota bacterium]MCB9043310.1 transcription antitermination factor NusB [Chitinophagales bacterium]
MYSRRLLRIKTFQALYSLDINTEQSDKALSSLIQKNIDNTYICYLLVWQYLLALADYAKTHQRIVEAKYIKDQTQELSFENVYENSFVQNLRNDESFRLLGSKYHLKNYIDENLVKSTFLKLLKEPNIESILNAPRNKSSEKKLIKFFLKKGIVEDPSVQEYFVETFLSWYDDDEFVINKLMTSLTLFFETDPKGRFPLYTFDLQEAYAFAINLYKQYRDHLVEIDEVIQPHLKNWDSDRINSVDHVLLRQALVEMLYCPEVPLKVTINEYVDISKEYSTAKSKEFINGLLDTIMKVLQKQQKIVKTGRGLVE